MSLHTAELTFQRSYPIAPARLWTLLTDPRFRAQWSPEGHEMIFDTTDLREGGVEQHRMISDTEGEMRVHTHWYRLDAPRLATFSETFVVEDTRLFTSLVSYGLSATARGAVLDIWSGVTSFAGPEMLMGFDEGWSMALTALDALAHSTEAEAVH